MIDKIEALVDSIAALHRAHNPESVAYQLRNPILLRSFARPGKHEVDELGRRIFGSRLDGYKAALFDVRLKLSGNSYAGIRAGDRLQNLLAVYGIKELNGVEQVVKYLRRALEDSGVSRETPLSHFTSVVKSQEQA